jgi:hypothetical protein
MADERARGHSEAIASRKGREGRKELGMEEMVSSTGRQAKLAFVILETS